MIINREKRIEMEKRILGSIGYATLGKNKCDYEKTHKFLNEIKISNIVVIKHFWNKQLNVYLTLKRPGLFIGKEGDNFKYITNFLSGDFNCKVKILLKECKIDDYLYPIDYTMMFNEDDFIE